MPSPPDFQSRFGHRAQASCRQHSHPVSHVIYQLQKIEKDGEPTRARIPLRCCRWPRSYQERCQQILKITDMIGY